MSTDGLAANPTQEQLRAWDVMCETVTDIMNHHTRPFVTPLVHDVPGEPLRFGGGTYLQVGSGAEASPTVLTCEHVARFQPQAHQPNGCKGLVPLQGQLCADRDVAVDAATMRIPETNWREASHGATPLSPERFAERHAAVPGEILFFRGLTGENAYVSGSDLDAVYTGYASQEQLDSGDDQIFDMLWNPVKARITPGTPAENAARVRYDDAHGYSGSLVWNTRFVEMGCDFSRWRPTHAVVAGLLRRWDTSRGTLLVWRVEHLRRWLAARPSWA